MNRTIEVQNEGRCATYERGANRDGDCPQNGYGKKIVVGDKGAFITSADFLIDGGATAAYFYGELKPEN